MTAPHSNVPVVTLGLEAGGIRGKARLAVIAAHGRGGSAQDMLGLAEHLNICDVAWFAPQAAANSWWPQSFLAPLEANEPWLTSALEAFEAAVRQALAAGFGEKEIVITGFSQGACLASEYVARSGRNYRAAAILSGALVGNGESDLAPTAELYGHADKTFAYAADLTGMPIYFGCHERDPHIPLARVKRSEAILADMGATVTTDILPGPGHGIVAHEIDAIRAVLTR